jgi:GT2 family glycosyltransferase
VTRRPPPDTEILVVDDGSPDGCISRAASEFPDVRVVRHDQRRGFCEAANTGVHAVGRPIVQLLNDDTEVAAKWAEPALVRFADRGVGAVAPLVLRGSPEESGRPIVDSAGDRYFIGGVVAKRGHGQPLSSDYLRPRSVFGASASSAFYRRQAFLDAGGFPSEFGAYFEDVDLAFRLHRLGFSIFFEPRSRVWHQGSGSYGPPTARLLAQQSRNEEFLFWRNLPLRTLAKALPFHVAIVVAKALRRAREGQLMPFLIGRMQAWLAIPRVAAHRIRLRALGPGIDPARCGIEQRYWGKAAIR